MKTATITWVTYNNYGTLLQAYALQKYLQQLGHENVLLSDEEILKEYRRKKGAEERKTAQPEQQTTRLARLLADPGRIGRSILARRDPERFGAPYEDSQAVCNAFRKRCLDVCYEVHSGNLAELNDGFDAFVCGSDQIWSLRESIFNPYYFLDFVRKPKIAFAPSLGMDAVPRNREETLKTLLADFSALSVREAATAEELSELTGRKVTWAADPTLLHDRMFWANFASGEKLRQKYLLCYFLENKQWYFEYARKLAKKRGLKLLLIPNRWDHLQHSFVVKDPVGPEEFVMLFQNADCVLTDSYHGSIFSMIFEKDFQYLQRFAEGNPESQNIRVRSLFAYLEIEERIVYENTACCAVPAADYQKIGRKLEKMRDLSREYLKTALK